ncbi:unnamed protein product [Psylliodes chrysocephalus]|uniref:Uncharacterized protein n=1 Tax=Psylliodes chrysocephalus TaxID=3402493 RepID=A0A9P0D282_9CUCU|nr:unnamed protein product [Psylliodes chrysocephala]
MSKRQSTLLGFVKTKKTKICSPFTTSDVHFKEAEVSEYCCSNTSSSSSTVQAADNRPIASIAFNSETRNVDFGFYIDIATTSFSDAEKANSLRNAWEPPEDFSYSFSVHGKNNKDVKCYLSKKHFDFLIEDLEYRFDNDLMNILSFNIALPSVFLKLSADEVFTSVKSISEFLSQYITDSPEILEIKLKVEIELWHKNFENNDTMLESNCCFSEEIILGTKTTQNVASIKHDAGKIMQFGTYAYA